MLFENIFYVGEDFQIHQGCVATQGDKIVSIGSRPEQFEGEVFSGRDKLLIPGLVNTHCHVPMTLLRGYGEGLPLDRWLNEKVFPFEDRLNEEDVYYASLLGIAEMLAGGVTSFSDMYMFCSSICDAVLKSGIRANISRGLTCFDDRDYFDLPAYQDTLELLERYNSGRIQVELSVHGEYTSPPKVVRQLAGFAKEKGLGIHIHLSETKKEHEECKARRGMTPAAYMADCGIFDSRVTAAHAVWVEDADIDLLARYGVSVAHCPTSNMKLASGFAPVERMLANGVNVGIGTDGASSNNNLNLLEEMHIAALIHKGYSGDPMALQPAQVLEMATAGGAKLQGRPDTGRIAVGCKADLAVLDCNRPHLRPMYDLLSNTLYSAAASDVVMTMVDGAVVYRDGVFAGIDLPKAMEKAEASMKRILSLL